jgi:RNA polymerase sigma factor (sigma-70 family)
MTHNKGKIKVGDHRTIERAFKYKDELYAYFCKALYDREDANDLVQLAIIRASRHVEPDLNDYEFKKRLFIIARQTLFTYYESKKNDFLLTRNIALYQDDDKKDDEISLSQFITYNHDDGIDYEMLVREFRKKLEPRYQKVLDLYLQGYSIKDIAETLNRTYYGINTYLTTIRRIFRKFMKEKGFVIRGEMEEIDKKESKGEYVDVVL